MKIISWNVNGIRAAEKKGFLDWLERESPDIVCVQETKAQKEQLSESLLKPKGYFTYWHSAEKKGYSGVATFSKKEAVSVTYGCGEKRFDEEGRVLMTEFEEFVLLNIYFPNGGRGDERVRYKLEFNDHILDVVNELRSFEKKVITCGDYNIAHKEIDLADPVRNAKVSGFLPEERAWLDKWVEHGQVDTFRLFCDKPEKYTWWDMRTRARERNAGWRIDYHFVSDDLAAFVRNAEIHAETQGSDHCPISLELAF